LAFLDFLADRKLIDEFGMRRAGAALSGSGQALDTVLLELGLLEEAILADALAEHLGLERVAAAEFPSELPLHDAMPHGFLRQANILPLAVAERSLTVAVARPLDDDAARALGYYLGLTPVLKVAIAGEIARHLSALLARERAEANALGEDVDASGLADSDAERLRDIANEAPIIRLFGRLVATAIERNASDIHIEPADDHVRIRYRIDGALQVGERLDRALQLALVSRVKILARLNIAEQRLPQDGRIRLAVRGRDIDFRVATSPTLHGESVALRVLDRRDVALNFPALGFDEATTRQLERLLAAPNGIVLVTGPTGSGKTTTLYAALALLNRPQSKLFTVEDPVEYHLKGVNQIPIRPHIGLDFAAVLRSILRQDPDVIMVGEIRDPETARIAVQASLTGHMVLSTLHTNSAAAAITRLRNIGIENFLIVSSLRAVVAQRLVRKLCERCKRPRRPLPAVSGSAGDADSNDVDGRFFEPAGCGHCLGTGYSGRTAIWEILEVGDSIQNAIVAGRPDQEIDMLARRQGMLSLHDCGLSRARSGQTSLDEVLRVAAAPAS
jgi:general secretion pathway protein E